MSEVETAIATTWCLEKATDKAIEKFSGLVIQRWSSYRAQKFMESFVNSVSSAESNEDLSEVLDGVFMSEKKTEILFDAYRAVCMAKSKTIGPRAIGVLTANAIFEGNRSFSPSEELWIRAFELLSDEELILAHEYIDEQISLVSKNENGVSRVEVTGNIEILVEEDQYGAGNEFHSFAIGDYLGNWALDLQNLGIFFTCQSNSIGVHHTPGFEGDGELYMNQSVKVILDKDTILFGKLIEAAMEFNVS